MVMRTSNKKFQKKSTDRCPSSSDTAPVHAHRSGQIFAMISRCAISAAISVVSSQKSSKKNGNKKKLKLIPVLVDNDCFLMNVSLNRFIKLCHPRPNQSNVCKNKTECAASRNGQSVHRFVDWLVVNWFIDWLAHSHSIVRSIDWLIDELTKFHWFCRFSQKQQISCGNNIRFQSHDAENENCTRLPTFDVWTDWQWNAHAAVLSANCGMWVVLPKSLILCAKFRLQVAWISERLSPFLPPHNLINV